MNDKCYHYYHKTDDDKVTYCKDCNAILIINPYWEGSLTIGKMETHYESDGVALDIRTLIKDQLGANINISSVILSAENSWDTRYMIGFSVGGGATIVANLTARRNDHYVPTGDFYVEPLPVVEEMTDADIHHAVTGE